MSDILVPDLPNLPAGAGVSSQTPDQSPSMAQQIAEMIRQVKAQNQPDLSQADQVVNAEDPAARKKRMIGTIIAGVAGALMGRNSAAGGLSGAAAAASGYNSGALEKTQQAQALKSKMLEDAARGNDKIVEHVVPKILDIQARREDPYKDMPNEVKQYLFAMKDPGFMTWLDRNNKGVNDPTEKKLYDAAVAQGYPGNLQSWLDRNTQRDPIKDVYTALLSGKPLDEGQQKLLKYHAGTSGLTSIAQTMALMSNDQSPQNVARIIKTLQDVTVPGSTPTAPTAPMSQY